METIVNCALQSWQIGIGDPGVMGWVIVAVYALTGLFAVFIALRGAFPHRSRKRERFFWCLLGLILLALAVNKQLDLQSLLTAGARCVAQLQGWYQQRRIVQVGFIVILIALMLLLALILWGILRGTLRRTGLPLLGLIILLGFVAIRAVGFHQMDTLINIRVQNIRLNWILELTGPLMILIGGAWSLRPRDQ